MSFIDGLLYPALRARGIRNLIVACDRSMLEAVLQEQGASVSSAGTGYVVAGLTAPSRFHAKMVLQVGPERLRVYIGSGNPTYRGYNQNAEVWDQFDEEEDDSPGRSAPVLAAATRFLARVLSSKNQPRAVQEASSALFASKPLQTLHRRVPAPGMISLLAVPNEDGATLFSEMARRVGSGVRRIRICAPYFDRELAALGALRRRWPGVPVEILTDPQLSNLDTDAVPADVAVRSARFATKQGQERRPIHAKIYEFETDRGWEVFAGSANCSVAALLSDGERSGNVELLLHETGEAAQQSHDALWPSLTLKSLTTEEQAEMRRRAAEVPETPQDAGLRLFAAERVGDRICVYFEGGTSVGSAGGLEVRKVPHGKPVLLGLATTGSATHSEPLPDDLLQVSLQARLVPDGPWTIVHDPAALADMREDSNEAERAADFFGRDDLTVEDALEFVEFLVEVRARPNAEAPVGGDAVSGSETGHAVLVTVGPAVEDAAPNGTMQTAAAPRAGARRSLSAIFRLVAYSDAETRDESSTPDPSDDDLSTDEVLAHRRAAPREVVDPEQSAQLVDSIRNRLEHELARLKGGEGDPQARVSGGLIHIALPLYLKDLGKLIITPPQVSELTEVLAATLARTSEVWSQPAHGARTGGLSPTELVHFMLMVAWRLGRATPSPVPGGLAFRALRQLVPVAGDIVIRRAEVAKLRRGPVGGHRSEPDPTVEQVRERFEAMWAFAGAVHVLESALRARWDGLPRFDPQSTWGVDVTVVRRNGDHFDYGFVDATVPRGPRRQVVAATIVTQFGSKRQETILPCSELVDIRQVAPLAGLEMSTVEHLALLH